jgi:hypothetical protein
VSPRINPAMDTGFRRYDTLLRQHYRKDATILKVTTAATFRLPTPMKKMSANCRYHSLPPVAAGS